MRMTDLWPVRTPASASARRRFGSARPPSPRPPMVRNPRRETPLQMGLYMSKGPGEGAGGFAGRTDRSIVPEQPVKRQCEVAAAWETFFGGMFGVAVTFLLRSE